MQKLTVIIPTYNEERNIKSTLEETLRSLDKLLFEYEIIVSDDGSTDNTVSIVTHTKMENEKIKLLINKHYGKAATINSALKQVNSEYCLFMDADNATTVNQVQKLILVMENNNADIVIGSREGVGSERINEPFYRHFLGRVFNFLVRSALSLDFQDTQCGFKLFKTSVLRELSKRSKIMNLQGSNLKEPLVTAFDVELLVIAKILGYKTVEVPIIWKHVKTKNINPFRDSTRMFKDVLLIRARALLGRYKK